jgi:hypothetical protein
MFACLPPIRPAFRAIHSPVRLAGSVLTALSLLCSLAKASEILPAGLYQMTTETGMPHLEANLGYATTHERRCLIHQELYSAFPVLEHVALKGCRLDHESRQDETVSYILSCEGPHGTTGTARWQLGPNQIVGTLNVKLGGKNMTFSQRVIATRLGECSPTTN